MEGPNAESILEWYRDDIASTYAAHGWYTIAQRETRRLARDHGTTRARAAGVIAALSPLQTWVGNVGAADQVLAAADRGDRTAPRVGLRRNVAKAWAIATGEGRPLDILSGPKVRAFYRNIMGDLSAVTVDRWAARAAGVTEAYPSTRARYDEVAACYIAAAAVVGVEPAILQAIVWCSIRGRAE